MFLADCPSFRARLTVAGCLANQASPNDNTRAICQRCQAKIAGDQVPAPSMTVSQRQSERAKMVRNRHGSSSAPVEPIFKYAAVAQKVERPPCKRVVPGSIPGSGSKKVRGSQAVRQRTVNPSSAGPIPAPSAKKMCAGVTIPDSPGRATGKAAPQPLKMSPDKIKECKAIARRLAKKYAKRPQPIVESGWVKASESPKPPSKMGRPPKCKCGVCKVVNCGGRPKGMTRQGEKRRGWPKGKLRGPRKVAA